MSETFTIWRCPECGLVLQRPRNHFVPSGLQNRVCRGVMEEVEVIPVSVHQEEVRRLREAAGRLLTFIDYPTPGQGTTGFMVARMNAAEELRRLIPSVSTEGEK